MQKGFNPMREVFFALCKSVDTPIALGAWLRFRHGCHDDLASLDIRPSDYTRADRFRDDYLVVSFLRKWKGLNVTVDRAAVALQSFTHSEDLCRETNRRIRTMALGPTSPLHQVFHLAQRKIASLLGPFSRFCVENSYGWGPGATVEIPRRRAFLDTKMCELPMTVTPHAEAWLRNVLESDRNWLEVIIGTMPDGPVCLVKEVFEIVDRCRVDTVPKSAKTDRTIAIEPRGNAFLQKGIGGYLRDRLRRAGQDLSDQSRNQELAKSAFSDSLATLDLKAASDSVSTELVYMLLPYEWASAMDALRSRYAEMPDGTRVRLEKFSSMGNGFTFELETLIFWALAQSVSDLSDGKIVSIYGDDIIVDRHCCPLLIEALSWCGFVLNVEKSFTSGSFFESCGAHYFDGELVTPIYQKEILVKEGLGIVRLGNRLIRLALQRGYGVYLDRLIEPAWRAARRYAGRTSRFFLPIGVEGDNGWLLPFEEAATLHIRMQHGICRFPVALARTRKFPACERSLYAWSLRRGVVTEEPYNDPAEGRCILSRDLATDAAEDVENYGTVKPDRQVVFVPSERWLPIPSGWSSLTFG